VIVDGIRVPALTRVDDAQVSVFTMETAQFTVMASLPEQQASMVMEAYQAAGADFSGYYQLGPGRVAGGAWRPWPWPLGLDPLGVAGHGYRGRICLVAAEAMGWVPKQVLGEWLVQLPALSVSRRPVENPLVLWSCSAGADYQALANRIGRTVWWAAGTAELRARATGQADGRGGASVVVGLHDSGDGPGAQWGSAHPQGHAGHRVRWELGRRFASTAMDWLVTRRGGASSQAWADARPLRFGGGGFLGLSYFDDRDRASRSDVLGASELGSACAGWTPNLAYRPGMAASSPWHSADLGEVPFSLDGVAVVPAYFAGGRFAVGWQGGSYWLSPRAFGRRLKQDLAAAAADGHRATSRVLLLTESGAPGARARHQAARAAGVELITPNVPAVLYTDSTPGRGGSQARIAVLPDPATGAAAEPQWTSTSAAGVSTSLSPARAHRTAAAGRPENAGTGRVSRPGWRDISWNSGQGAARPPGSARPAAPPGQAGTGTGQPTAMGPNEPGTASLWQERAAGGLTAMLTWAARQAGRWQNADPGTDCVPLLDEALKQMYGPRAASSELRTGDWENLMEVWGTVAEPANPRELVTKLARKPDWAALVRRAWPNKRDHAYLLAGGQNRVLLVDLQEGLAGVAVTPEQIASGGVRIIQGQVVSGLEGSAGRAVRLWGPGTQVAMLNEHGLPVSTAELQAGPAATDQLLNSLIDPPASRRPHGRDQHDESRTHRNRKDTIQSKRKGTIHQSKRSSTTHQSKTGSKRPDPPDDGTPSGWEARRHQVGPAWYVATARPRSPRRQMDLREPYPAQEDSYGDPPPVPRIPDPPERDSHAGPPPPRRYDAPAGPESSYAGSPPPSGYGARGRRDSIYYGPPPPRRYDAPAGPESSYAGSPPPSGYGARGRRDSIYYGPPPVRRTPGPAGRDSRAASPAPPRSPGPAGRDGSGEPRLLPRYIGPARRGGNAGRPPPPLFAAPAGRGGNAGRPPQHGERRSGGADQRDSNPVSDDPFFIISEGDFTRRGAQVETSLRAPLTLSEAARGTLIDLKPIKLLTANSTRILRFAGGIRGIYKPVSGEDPKLLYIRFGVIPKGGQAYREVAAFEAAQELHFNLVPETIIYHGYDGLGSVQRWVENAEGGKPIQEYSKREQEMMAVLDYFIANNDRHRGNYLTGPARTLVGIDNGLIWPLSNHLPIRSDFVAAFLGKQLSEDVLARIRSVDLDAMARRVESSGIERTAVDGGIARLKEMRVEGKITGAAWGGVIIDNDFRIINGGGFYIWAAEKPRLERELGLR
jgi:hypothetical protein